MRTKLFHDFHQPKQRKLKTGSQRIGGAHIRFYALLTDKFRVNPPHRTDLVGESYFAEPSNHLQNAFLSSAQSKARHYMKHTQPLVSFCYKIARSQLHEVGILYLDLYAHLT